MRPNLTTKEGKDRPARACAVRFASFLLAVLVAFSISAGGGHAQSAMAGETHVAVDHVQATSDKAHPAHAHTIPCDDGGLDNCCISASSCSICASVQSSGFAFVSHGTPVTPTASSALLPRDPPALQRPPKLSVTA